MHTFLFKYILFLSIWLSSLSIICYASERYLIDPENTVSSFEYRTWGKKSRFGSFDKSNGVIELDFEKQTGFMTIIIDSNSINTGSELFNNIMRSPSFFATQQYPTIVFISTKLIFDAKKLSQIEGNLTIKGIIKPVVVEVTEFNCHPIFINFNDVCDAKGHTKILRSEYKMDRFSSFVSDEITLYFDVEGIKE